MKKVIKESLKESLKESFKVIKDHKYIFIILFITQALFLFSISAIYYYYAVQIGEHAQAILEPLQESVQDQEAMEAGIYSLPPEAYSNYSSMINKILMFFIFAYITYIILNGVNWDLTNFMLTEKDKWLHYTSMFALITIAFTLPAMIIINIISSLFIALEAAGSIIILGLIILVICIYFMYIAFSMINHYKHKEIKAIFKHSYQMGMKNFKTLLPTYILMLIPIAISFWLIYFLLYGNIYLLFFSMALLVLSINWSRIYFLVTMEKLRGF